MIPKPAQVGMIFEVNMPCILDCGTWHIGGYRNPWGMPPQHFERCDHNNGMNVAFTDGHAKWVAESYLCGHPEIFGDNRP